VAEDHQGRRQSILRAPSARDEEQVGEADSARSRPEIGEIGSSSSTRRQTCARHPRYDQPGLQQGMGDDRPSQDSDKRREAAKSHGCRVAARARLLFTGAPRHGLGRAAWPSRAFGRRKTLLRALATVDGALKARAAQEPSTFGPRSDRRAPSTPNGSSQLPGALQTPVPDAIPGPAEHRRRPYWQLHRRSARAWTFEMDYSGPWEESW